MGVEVEQLSPPTRAELTPEQRDAAVRFHMRMADRANTHAAAAIRLDQVGAAIRSAGDALGHLIDAQQIASEGQARR